MCFIVVMPLIAKFQGNISSCLSEGLHRPLVLRETQARTRARTERSDAEGTAYTPFLSAINHVRLGLWNLIFNK